MDDRNKLSPEKNPEAGLVKEPIHILLVEDEEAHAELVRRAFESHTGRFRLTMASNLEEAQACLSQGSPPDLIITDLVLPDGRGTELLLPGSEQRPLPIVLMTSHGDEKVAVEAMKAGALDYVVKSGTTLVGMPRIAERALREWGHITERRRAEEALRQRNRELALLIRVGQGLAATLDLQQVVEQSLQTVTETIEAEDASVWLWEGEQKEWLVCQAAFHQGGSRPPVDLRLRSGQGIAGWVAEKGESVVVASVLDDPRFFPGIDEQTGFHTSSLIAVPLRARGTVVGVLEVVNKRRGDFDADDLTLVETLAASAAIAIDNAQLVEKLRQHTVELEAHNEELDAFAHTVAHDLKGPLAPLIGYAAVLAMDHAGTGDPDELQYLTKIVQGGRKMSRIIDALLLLAGARKMDVDVAPLDMAGIVEESMQRLAYMIEEYQAEVVLPETWPVALGYGPWVEEVWFNYLSNGIKYGGRPPRVELGADLPPPSPGGEEAEERVVRFWIRDNGPGLTPEEQGRLFTPFTRLEQVRTKGHGLGLSIVRRIVEKLDGQIGVESEVGQGSVFSFTLRMPPSSESLNDRAPVALDSSKRPEASLAEEERVEQEGL